MSNLAIDEAGTSLNPAKREQILLGAQAVFLARGYEGASMSLIAREAGVSKGTLYVYFDNKEALFAAFMESACRLQSGRAFEVLNRPEPVDRVLSAFGHEFLRFLLGDHVQSVRRLVIGESKKFPELGRAYYDAGPRVATNRLKEFLKRRVETGELDIDDLSLAATQFLNLCQADLVLMRNVNVIETATPQRIAHVIERAVWLFLKGYGAHR
ncbi:MAG: TetR/AcrR family transcriptional regulator [Parvibaculum sp.]|uniref:TetR/AcrR family transcriptional regulator C-terminal domain-containing protein n=1 Tax=Parvibaculum sp. TaxID=2024848 RepID=UPI003C712A23